LSFDCLSFFINESNRQLVHNFFGVIVSEVLSTAMAFGRDIAQNIALLLRA